jgi:hypothetical protein
MLQPKPFPVLESLDLQMEQQGNEGRVCVVAGGSYVLDPTRGPQTFRLVA